MEPTTQTHADSFEPHTLISSLRAEELRTLLTVAMPNREGFTDGARPQPDPNPPVPASTSR